MKLGYKISKSVSFMKPVKYGCDKKFLDAPITNLPAGAKTVRRRIRADEMAQVYVKTDDGAVTRYFAGPDGPGALRLLWATGTNWRLPA